MKGLCKKRLRNAAGCFVLSAMLLLGGCGSADLGSATMDAMTNGSGMKYTAESAVDGGSFYSGTTSMEQGVMEEAKAVENESQPSIDRKLIKTVNMNVETQEFDSLMATVQEQVKTLGGYIENLNTYNGSQYSGYRGVRNADLTIRIPKDKLDVFLESVSGISNVVRRSDTVEDVTLAYVDLESHKEALETEQDRLLELLERAESIEDIITIEERLSNVRYQLESMESQLRTFDNQVDYSTVYLKIEEVEIFTPVEEETAWERISGGFVESLQDIADDFVEFVIWFLVHIPYMVAWCVVLALLIGGILLFVKLLNRKSAKKQRKQQAVNSQNIDVQKTDEPEK